MRTRYKWGNKKGNDTSCHVTCVNLRIAMSHTNIVSGDDDENTDWFCFPGGELEVDPRPNLTCNWKMIQAIYICKRLRNYWNAAKLLKHSQTGFNRQAGFARWSGLVRTVITYPACLSPLESTDWTVSVDFGDAGRAGSPPLAKNWFILLVALHEYSPCACSGRPNPSKILEVSSLFQSRSWLETFITPCDVSACSFRLSSLKYSVINRSRIHCLCRYI